MAKTKRNSKMPVSRATNAYELLAEIRQIILEEPKRYDQECWNALLEKEEVKVPDCGTVGCVAGWVVTLKRPGEWDMSGTAKGVLGLTTSQADRLFMASACSGTTPQTKAHAKRGAAHIARFMKEHKAQLKAKAV